MLLMLSSCDGKKQPEFLKLSSVPTVTVNPTNETVRRYNKEYTDTFVPSEDYGALVPFVGGMYEYNGVEEADKKVSLPIYGLCTTNGEIVVDPVYDGVITHNLKGGVLYELLIGSNDASLAEKRLLISSSGRFVKEIDKNCVVSNISGEECFAIERTKKVWRNYKRVTYKYYDFYSYDLQFLFTFDTKLTQAQDKDFSLGDFNDGLMPVNVAVTTETVQKGQDGKDVVKTSVENYGYFVDIKGKQTFKDKEFLKVEEFSDGVAVVCNKEGLYGVIKSDGSYLLEPQYTIINRNIAEGYFALGLKGYFIIADKSGKTISKVSCENAEISVIGTDKIIYKKTFKYSGKTEFLSCVTNGAFVCTETGQFPDSESGEFGLFSCTYSGVTDVFLSDGKSIAQFNDFGYIAGLWGNIAVIINKDGSKSAVLNIENGTKTEWIDARFDNEAFNDGKYVVLKSNAGYLLFNSETNEFEVKSGDIIKVLESDGVSVLCVIEKGYVTLYSSNMNVLMRYRYKTEVASR